MSTGLTYNYPELKVQFYVDNWSNPDFVREKIKYITDIMIDNLKEE